MEPTESTASCSSSSSTTTTTTTTTTAPTAVDNVKREATASAISAPKSVTPPIPTVPTTTTTEAVPSSSSEAPPQVQPQANPALGIAFQPSATSKCQVVRGQAIADQFVKTFDLVWKHMLAHGWQIAATIDTASASHVHPLEKLLCIMPDTAFDAFVPNVTLFDCQEKACWKWLQVALAEEQPKTNTDFDPLYDALWTILEQEFKWFTIQCGPETWFVRANTIFSSFRPNETIFQFKHQAIRKFLESEALEVRLSDSQTLHFFKVPETPVKAPPKPNQVELTQRTKKTKKPVPRSLSPHQQRAQESQDNTILHADPIIDLSSPAAKAPAKRTIKNSTKKAATTSARKTPQKRTKVQQKKKLNFSETPSPRLSRAASAKPSPTSCADTLVLPQFKCTFGKVYQCLQRLGWYHRPGRFEYDYFRPDYKPENAVLNENYFLSAAELEEYLQGCGLWSEIEEELRREHELYCQDLIEEDARKKRINLKKRENAASPAVNVSMGGDKENVAIDASNSKHAVSSSAGPKKPKAGGKRKKPSQPKQHILQELRNAKFSDSADGGFSFTPSQLVSDAQDDFKVSMGKVIGKLVLRGWTYKPGKFEYDYFKPNFDEATGVLNEDYFQSEADLETYLRTTKLWNEIEDELLQEFIDQKLQQQQQQKHKRMRVEPPTQFKQTTETTIEKENTSADNHTSVVPGSTMPVEEQHDTRMAPIDQETEAVDPMQRVHEEEPAVTTTPDTPETQEAESLDANVEEPPDELSPPVAMNAHALARIMQ